MTECNEERQRAYDLYYAAVKSGELIRSDTCEECGKTRSETPIHGHHHKGYAIEHALDVVWLCAGCHNKVHERLTFEQRSRGGRASAAKLTPATRTLAGRRGIAALRAGLTPEQLSTLGRLGAAAGASKGGKAATAKAPREWHAAGARAALAKLTHEQRSVRAKKAVASQTPEQRSAKSKKGWETRRANAAARAVQAGIADCTSKVVHSTRTRRNG